MKLPVYVPARREIVWSDCSWPVFAAYVAARALVYVAIVAASMLLPRQAGIVLAGVATAYLGAMVVDGLLPRAFLWVGLVHVPDEADVFSRESPNREPVAPPVCWCAYCAATRVSERLLSLSAKERNAAHAVDLCEMSERIEAMYPETRTHQGPCSRDGLVFCSTLCSMGHKRGAE